MTMTHTTGIRRLARPAIILLVLLLCALTLAACGNETTVPPTPGPPTATPVATLRLDVDPELYYQITVPSDWIKDNQSTSVGLTRKYSKPGNSNYGLVIASLTSPNVTANSTALLQAYLSVIRPNTKDYKEGPGGTITINGVVQTLTQVEGTSATDTTPGTVLITQVNLVPAQRAYLLVGAFPKTEEAIARKIITDAMASIVLNPPAALAASPGADTNPIVATAPTPIPELSGGKVTPTSATAQFKGQYLTLTNWQSPNLLATQGNVKVLTVSGSFPSLWQWSLKGFPRRSDAGIYLTAPPPAGGSVSSAEATVQVAVLENKFTTASPSPKEITDAITPLIEYYNANYLAVYGSATKLTVPESTGGTYKSVFIARNTDGITAARGTVYFRAVGQDLVMSVVTIGPDASLKPTVVAGYDADLLALTNSLKINR